MVGIISTNITSPLGLTTNENFHSVMEGKSALQTYTGMWSIPEPFCASMFSHEQELQILENGLSRFESIVLYSIRQACTHTNIDIASNRTLLILSTTKGNIESMERGTDPIMGCDTKKIAAASGLKTSPVTVCNACSSGVSAIILASRLLNSESYDNVIVCGADCLSKFIVSGFLSLKVLSHTPCKPFDIDRTGLNLGEAAATIVLSRLEQHCKWHISKGVIRNDAYHISSPSKNSEGAFLSLEHLTDGIDKNEIAFINAHGTGTMFNDQMESVAIQRARLSSVPVNSYKAYFGHTMGAAGILETVLSIEALNHGIILPTKGYEESGVSGKVEIIKTPQTSKKPCFIKMISGFGGSNASLLCSKNKTEVRTVPPSLEVTHTVNITPSEILLDNNRLEVSGAGIDMLTDIYRKHIDHYPRFYKMDMLCRLGFVASELLLKAEGKERFVENDDRAVILFNRSSSISSDKKYQATITEAENYFPNPTVFVYTLPNIVTGEIAIRNHYHGETSLYILASKDTPCMQHIITSTFLDKATTSIITGWIDCMDDKNFIAELALIQNNNNNKNK